jgi:hypothetical protein
VNGTSLDLAENNVELAIAIGETKRKKIIDIITVINGARQA